MINKNSRDINQFIIRFLINFFQFLLGLAYSLFIIISLFLYYQSALLILQDLSVLDSIKLLTPSFLFYLGISYWLFLLCRQTTRARLIKRSALLAVATSAVILSNIVIALFAKLGDGTSLYVLYYFLTDFTNYKPSFLSFHLLVYSPFILIALISAWYFHQFKQEHKTKALIHLSLACLMVSAGFFSFSPNIAKSHSANLFSYTLASFAESPKPQHFQQPLIQPETPSINRPALEKNIAIIILESTRKDALSFYNPELKHKTPFFDQLAQDSLVFHHAQTVVPHTSKALVNIHCGLAPYLNMPIAESLYGMPADCLASQLSQHGYQSIFMQSATRYFENRAELVKQFGFQQFFSAEDVDTDKYQKNYFGFGDEVILERNKQWLSEQQSPFIASYLTIGPHWPYELDPTKEELKFFKPQYDGLRLFDLQKPFNHYLNNVHYQDEFLEQLFQQYKDAGLYENTVFIVLADHGESFGEHHHLQHNNNLYPEVLDIPMLVHIPFAKQYHGENHDLVQQKDIISIVNNILQQNAPLAHINNDKLFAACWYWRWCLARTDDNYRYIHNFDIAPDELYDVQRDAKMHNNTAADNIKITQQFRRETLAWYNSQLALYWQQFQPKDPNFYRMGSPGGTNLGTFQKESP